MIFVQPMEGINLMTNAESFAERHPEYQERFDAIQEQRQFHQEWNESKQGQRAAFRSVASLMLPIDRALWLTNENIMKDKKHFYAWLNANPQYATYDIRKAQAQTTRPHTYVDGKAV